jgi:hypothetical protein
MFVDDADCDSAALQHRQNVLSSLRRFDFVMTACLKDNRPFCVLVGCCTRYKPAV